MPLLPSGLMLGISALAIPDRPDDIVSRPPGHFLYFKPDDVACGPPPYHEGQLLEMHLVAAPLPQSHEELKPYIQLIQLNNRRESWWAGEWLSEFPGRMQLDQADLKAWQTWLGSKETLDYLDEIILVCHRQAEYLDLLRNECQPSKKAAKSIENSQIFNAPESYSSLIERFKHYYHSASRAIPEFLSEQELHKLGLNIVVDSLKKMGHEILQVNTALKQNPQLITQHDGKQCMIAVRTECFPLPMGLTQHEKFWMLDEAYKQGMIAYYTRVQLHNLDATSSMEFIAPIKGGNLKFCHDGLSLISDIL